MKELKASYDLPTITLWDELIVREAEPPRPSRPAPGRVSPIKPPSRAESHRLSPPKGPDHSTPATVCPSAPAPSPVWSPPAAGLGCEVSHQFLDKWTKGICQHAPAGDNLPETLETVQNFLQMHPNLGSDQKLADLVLLCLRNYINADPDFALKPFAEKLAHAAEMAGKFIVFTAATP
jgi:hypothetical protein